MLKHAETLLQASKADLLQNDSIFSLTEHLVLALGWSYLDTDLATTIVTETLSHQQNDGHLRHSIGDTPWCELSALPILALVLQRITSQSDNVQRIKPLLPRVEKLHAWFWKNRDPLNMKWIAVTHPVESNDEDNPIWDQPLGFTEDDSPVETSKRNSALLKQVGEGKPFSIYNPFLSAIFILNEEILVSLGKQFRLMTGAKRRAALGRAALLDRPWDGSIGRFRYVDHLNGRSLHPDCLSTHMPLLLGLPGHMKKQVLEVLGERYSTPFGMPTLPTDSPHYDPQIPWRGAVHTWTNWWLAPVMERDFTESFINLAETNGCYLHFNSQTGEGIGLESPVAAAMLLDIQQNMISNPDHE